MKYIKQFEKKYNNFFYWLIPKDERFIDSAKKIGVSSDYIETLKHIDGEHDYIFIGYNPYGNFKWSWMPYEGDIKSRGYELYDFQGTVNMEEGEIELRRDMKKYNL